MGHVFNVLSIPVPTFPFPLPRSPFAVKIPVMGAAILLIMASPVANRPIRPLYRVLLFAPHVLVSLRFPFLTKQIRTSQRPRKSCSFGIGVLVKWASITFNVLWPMMILLLSLPRSSLHHSLHLPAFPRSLPLLVLANLLFVPHVRSLVRNNATPRSLLARRPRNTSLNGIILFLVRKSPSTNTSLLFVVASLLLAVAKVSVISMGAAPSSVRTMLAVWLNATISFSSWFGHRYLQEHIRTLCEILRHTHSFLPWRQRHLQGRSIHEGYR